MFSYKLGMHAEEDEISICAAEAAIMSRKSRNKFYSWVLNYWNVSQSLISCQRSLGTHTGSDTLLLKQIPKKNKPDLF